MLCLFYGVPEGLPVSVFRWSVVWQYNFPANHSAFAGVILILAVIKTVKLFAGAVGGAGNHGERLAAPELLNMKMVEGY
jgi:hypothetical protein